MKLFMLVRLNLLQTVREPIQLFWAFGLPLGLFLVFVPVNEEIRQVPAAFLVAPFAAYSAFYTGAGVGLRLINWRERGMLKTFAQNPRSRHRVFAAWAIEGALMAGLLAVGYWVIALFRFGQSPSWQVVALVAATALGSTLIGWASLAFNVLRLREGALVSMVAGFNAVCLAIVPNNVYASRTTGPDWYWFFVPQRFVVALQSFLLGESSVFSAPPFWIMCLVLLGVGFAGLRFLRILPMETR